VNTPPPDGVDEQDLAGALAGSWGLGVRRPRYVPKGFGSHHWLAETPEGQRYFVTVDELDSKTWLGADRESRFEGLASAYETAVLLHERAHLSFVVPPIPTLDGAPAVRLTPDFSLAVFAFIDGTGGEWADRMSPDERDQLMRLLAELHLSTPTVASRARRRPLEIPGRAGLEAALDELERPWTGGPFSEPARHRLAVNAEVVGEWLASFDDLAARLAKTHAPLVVTHGEPHPGNLIKVEGGFRLVDWDTVALAEPERDLWMFDDGSAGRFATYSQATGTGVDDTALSLYRLAWTLTDIASFTARFRSRHQRNHDTQKAWTGLTDLLRGSWFAPYGPALCPRP
jgi:spectinomycin phosphotransferase